MPGRRDRRRAARGVTGLLVAVLAVAAPAAAADAGTAVPRPGLRAVGAGDAIRFVDAQGVVRVELGDVNWHGWSHDGALIAYNEVDDRERRPVGDRVVVAGTDGSAPVVVSPNGGRALWSPVAEELLVSGWGRAGDEATLLLDGTGTVRRVLFRGAPVSWSPDGARVLYTVTVPDPDHVWGRTEHWVHELATGDDQHLDGFDGNPPTWSPDGQRLVGNRGPAGDGVWVLDLRTGGLTRILDNGWDPTWAPAGDLVAVGVPDSPDTSGVLLVDVGTARTTVLTAPGPHTSTGGLAWSPTGEAIAVIWENGLEQDTVALHDAAGRLVWSSGPLLGTFAGGPFPIVWTPDGTAFAWWNGDPGDQLVTADGVTSRLPVGGTVDWQAARPSDVGTSVFAADVAWLWSQRITKGCDPPWGIRYCPDAPVTRGQVAAFLVRALGLADDGGGDLFIDDDGSVFEGDIDRVGAAAITRGCNPPANDRFCPDRRVTRGELAAFLVRALGLADDGGGDLFIDDDGSAFEGDIDRLGAAAITRGCNPPANDRFCPDDPITRGQVAAFLHRALGPG